MQRVAWARIAMGAFLGLFVTQPASALTLMFHSVGDTGSFEFLFSNTDVDLQATVDLEVIAIAGGNTDIEFTVDNDTIPTGDRLDLTSIGLVSVDPDVAVTLLTAGTVFDGIALDTTFPGFQTVDACVFVGQNCAGAGNEGLGAGESDSFTLRFATDQKLTLEGFASKWQTDFGSFEVPGVPEPGTGLLLGLGLASLAATGRRVR